MKPWFAAVLIGCVHPVNVPSTVQASGSALWIGAESNPPEGIASLQFVELGRETAEPICQAPQRGRPLWQQLDVGAVRVVCTANPNRLSRRDRLEQRYQAPVALAPSDVEHLIIAVADTEKHGRVLREDLLSAADPLALRMEVVRGASTEALLPSGPWGVLRLTVDAGQSVILEQDGTALTLTGLPSGGMRWSPMTGWAAL